ncbi:hypothetical protein GGS20DRAFT_453257 [Poronia punctata]|nr:hypothetical protein GGS20DRAFT_453257 [Poronia punctata]
MVPGPINLPQVKVESLIKKMKAFSSEPKTVRLSNGRLMTLNPPPAEPPRCRRCRETTTLYITSPDNPNGNARRPYYCCSWCDKFSVFADYRGNWVTNPRCDCWQSSKRQVTGIYNDHGNKVPGMVHFVCRLGKCGFNERKRRIVYQQDEYPSLIEDFII